MPQLLLLHFLLQVGGVYRLACMMEHCCIPTGHRTFNQDFSITVRAAYGLEQGDSVRCALVQLVLVLMSVLQPVLHGQSVAHGGQAGESDIQQGLPVRV